MSTPKRPTFFHRVQYVAMRIVLGFTNLMPEVVAYGFADLVGRLFFRLSRRRQGFAMRHLRAAFGTTKSEAELLRIGRVSTGAAFKAAVDMTRVIPVLRKGTLLDHVVNAEELKSVPAAPALLVSLHLGGWEIGAMAFATIGTPCHAIGRRFKNPLIDDFVFGTRERAGLFVHPRRGGIRPVARALEAGCYGLQVVDQNQRLRGVFAPWFGQRASCERAAASLALRRGYPIFVGVAYREGRGMRFRLRGMPALRPVPTGDHAADVLALVTALNRQLEACILERPEQYLWIHDRYRTQPDPTAPAPTDDAEAGFEGDES